MFAIYKREFKSYFHSVIGWLFIATIIFFLSLYGTVYNLVQGSPYISYALSSSMIVFIIAIPILTMRILAEERKNKTDQLILTAPVTVWKIVLGKYLSMETVFAIPCLIACLFPVILSRFGTVPFAESYVAILGYFLFGSTAIAIGLFISSVTESQVIAAVITILLIFLGYIMSGLCSMISSDGNILTKIMGAYDLTTPFSNIANGTLDITAIVYYASICILMVYLTIQSIQKRRFSVSKQTVSLGTYNLGMVVIAIAVTIVANLLVNQIPTKYTNIDMTAEKLYSLTDSTYDILDGLTENVTINVLATKSEMDSTVVKTLDRYAEASDYIDVEYIDPTTNPTFYEQYTDSTVSTGSIIVVSDERSKTISYSSLYETDYDYTTYTSSTTGYDGEGQITSAIAYVTSDDMPKIYFITGHGEADFDSDFSGAVAKLNVDYEDLTLLTVDAVPDDAECIIVNAPTEDLSSDDAQKIQDYIDQGGNVIFIYGYSASTDLTNYKNLLAANGITIEDGIIYEENLQYCANNYPNYLLPTIESDEITSDIDSAGYVFVPNASGIEIDEDATDTTYLLETSDQAYITTDSNPSGTKPSDAVEGQFALGAEVTKTDNDVTSNIVVYTSADIFTAEADSLVAGNNQLLFTGTLSQFIDVESSVNIPVKEYELSTITISSGSIILYSLAITVVLPIILILIGLFIWLDRRRK